MNIFLSYPSEEHDIASRIAHALRDDGDSVFFDRTSLPPGESYDTRIRDAIARAELFLFLVTPRAIAAGSYAFAELGMAEQVAQKSSLKVLPVMIADTAFAAMPPYLRGITVFRPAGELVAEVVAAAAVIRADFDRQRVIVTSTIDNASWTLVFRILDDDCGEIFFRFAEESEFRSLGITGCADNRGHLMPNYFTVVPPLVGTHNLLVKYTDHAGREHGPYTVVIDAEQQMVAAAKELLGYSGPLVLMKEVNGAVYTVFTPVHMSSKNAIREIQYSVNNVSLSERLVQGTDNFANAIVELPLSTRYIYMKLLFIDGSESVPERFNRQGA